MARDEQREQRAATATMQPLFIFSIARCGSTLLQRVLGCYPEIATVSEPWLLIPLLYTTRRRGVLSEYTHRLAVDAIEDFARQLPRGREDYLDEIRGLTMRLYRKAAGREARYFLDKTPPYFLIVEDVMQLFPEAKCIFLWRNPLSVVASLANFDGGTWNPASHKENLFNGIANLTAAQQRHADRVCSVRYEDLVSGSEPHWRRLTDYLDMEFDPTTLSRFEQVRLEGRMGDPHGTKEYAALSAEPLTKWRRTLNTPVRRAWCVRYLQWIGAERLRAMGYEIETLLAELDDVPVDWSRVPGDCRRVAGTLLKEPLRVRARRSLGLGGPSPLRYLL